MTVTTSIEYVKHLVAISNEGWALKYVPKELKIKELCSVAVDQEGSALEFIPTGMIDKKCV